MQRQQQIEEELDIYIDVVNNNKKMSPVMDYEASDKILRITDREEL